MESMLDLVEGMPSGLDLVLKEGHSDIIDEEEPVPQAPRIIKRKKRTRRRRHKLNPNDIININNISRASDLVDNIEARRGVQHIDNPIDLHVLSEILRDKKKKRRNPMMTQTSYKPLEPFSIPPYDFSGQEAMDSSAEFAGPSAGVLDQASFELLAEIAPRLRSLEDGALVRTSNRRNHF